MSIGSGAIGGQGASLAHPSMRETGLSVGVANRAASITNPLDCAYSMNTSLNRGAVFSAVMTMDFMLSGMTTGNTAAK